jgi:hypothetical protein
MGYTTDTHMCQYIPPTLFHAVTGTFTWTAGSVPGTIAKHRAAANETSVINIPIVIPSNSIALKGAMLKSIEVDFENATGVISTSLTPLLNKVTRGIENAVAVVTTPVITYTPDAAGLLTQTPHKLVVTLTTPEWVDNDVFYLLELTLVAGGGGSTQDFLGAVANFTLRE